MKFPIHFFALLLFPQFLIAQMQPLHTGEIVAGLQKLGVQGSVLYIAAHPDDENTRLLAYFAKELKVRTGYLSLTRGDGGQNLIGNEQAELLGLIRTQELLAARRTDGAEQFFTRANDFGFSKTSDESFKLWGKEQILADAVWVIRKFRPNVIITRFPEDARAGHGHHAGSAIIAREAFVAAADPKRFPEQLKFVKPWQAKRILWNTFNFGGNNTTAPDQLKVDVGLYNPLLGRSYGEIAAMSRTNHKSQGFGSALQRGESFEFFVNVAGDPAKTSLFDGIDLALDNKEIKELLTEAQKNFNPNAPWLTIPQLLKLKVATKQLTFNHQLLDELIMACAGVWVEAISAENSYAVGDTIPVKIQFIKRSPDFVGTNGAEQSTVNADGKVFPVVANQPLNIDVRIPAKIITQPYWLTSEHPIGQYKVGSQEEVGFPENPEQLSYKLSIKIMGSTINLVLPIQYKFTDPAKGEKYQPLIVAPQVTATMSEKAYIFNGSAHKTINVQLHSFKNQASGKITPILPKGWRSVPTAIDYQLAKKGDEQTISFEIIPGNEIHAGKIELNLTAATPENKNPQKIEATGLRTMNYDHIPTITIFPPATASLQKIELKIVGKKIVYIDGAGDLTAQALKEMGYEVSHLTPWQIINTDLSVYDAIVTGVRLYNISEEIKLMQPKLLAYVEKGGTLLLQYNVNTNLKIQNLGPYPFRLSNKRVTEEDAKVNFLSTAHAALNYPNKITAQDFEGWVQERGIYFGVDIDPRYTTILSMNDTNEASADGSVLIADYGKGKYVYTSLVFFRELPAGVPGAYRLFANLLAPRKP
jgi:LmbE family N-acetylglucosaminyl deacetylase